MRVSALYIYPIKSLGGISLSASSISDRGLLHDRRWMLVDEQGVFLSQRSFPEMALLAVGLTEDHLFIQHKVHKEKQLRISLDPFSYTGEKITARVWEDQMPAVLVGEKEDRWFSEVLGRPIRLVYMPEHSHRKVKESYSRNQDLNSFSDAMPFLMIGEASLTDLNARLKQAVPMDRFRPNIVFEGGEPYEEDLFGEIHIGENRFFGVKPCARCNLTTVDQSTAAVGKEPLKTLTSYRRRENKVLFGMNLLHEGEGEIAVGQEIHVIRRNMPLFL